MGRDAFTGEPEFRELLAGHHPRGELRQRHANRLADGRDRPRRPRIDLQNVNLAVVDRVLHVHQADNAEFAREHSRLFDQLVLNLGAQRTRRQHTGAVARMNPGVLDVLHDTANYDALAVGDRVNVNLDRAVEITIDEQRTFLGRVQRLFEITPQPLLVGNDLHRTPAKHVGRPNQYGIADLRRAVYRFGGATGKNALRLPQVEAFDQLIESFAIFGPVDRVGRSAKNPNSRTRKRHRQLERRLAAKLHDHAHRLLALDDCDHVLEGERLEIQPI